MTKQATSTHYTPTIPRISELLLRRGMEDLTVVLMAQRAIRQRRPLAEVIAILRVDADKIRPLCPKLYAMLEGSQPPRGTETGGADIARIGRTPKQTVLGRHPKACCLPCILEDEFWGYAIWSAPRGHPQAKKLTSDFSTRPAAWKAAAALPANG